MNWTRDRVRTEARRAAGWTTVALGFTIPMWVVADSILVVLLVLCWAACGQWRERFRRIIANPVALSALLLFGWVLAGAFWGLGSLDERLLAVKKYADLLLIPLLISLAIDDQERNRALLTLAASLVVTLVLSLVLSTGFLLSNSVTLSCNPANPCVFKKHTTHNVLMAFGVLLFVVLAWRSQDKWVQRGWGLASILGAINVVMVHGRTGYVVLAGLAMLIFAAFYGWRGMFAAIVVLSVSFSAAYQVSPSFHERVNLTVSSVTEWNPEVAVVEDAVGWRLEYFYHTAEIIQDHPVMGVGTGGFVPAYRARVEQAGFDVPPHPHNQYLFIMAQVGTIGLGLLLWLFAQQWRSTARIEDATYRLLAKGLVVTIVLGSFFNPFLVDHTEKLLYCWCSGLIYSGIDSRGDERV